MIIFFTIKYLVRFLNKMFKKASVIQAETRIRGMICRDCKKGSILSVSNFQGGWLSAFDSRVL